MTLNRRNEVVLLNQVAKLIDDCKVNDTLYYEKVFPCLKAFFESHQNEEVYWNKKTDPGFLQAGKVIIKKVTSSYVLVEKITVDKLGSQTLVPTCINFGMLISDPDEILLMDEIHLIEERSEIEIA